MGTGLISVLGFLLAIGILITVHELGHFWVARYFGIRVLRFSLGFGRPLFRWSDKRGTEYVLSSIPLGGYVALFGEKPRDILQSERREAFFYQSVWVRIAVLVAGPAFNLLLAVVAYWCMLMIGIVSVLPILGNIPLGSVADLAGLRPHQVIVAIEDTPTPSWEAVSVALVAGLGEGKQLSIRVKERDTDHTETHTLDLSSVEQKGTKGDVLRDVGLIPLDPMLPIVGRVLPHYPAEAAGIQVGDRIIAADGHTMHSRSELTEYIQEKSTGVLALDIIRNEKTYRLNVQPMTHPSEKGQTTRLIGIEYASNHLAMTSALRLERLGPREAFWQALKRTAEYTMLTVNMVRKMVMGSISVEHLSGPISIAQYAGQAVTGGVEYFLSFLALISISLGVMNLLPIPLLDGGHLLYCTWELFTGRRVAESVQALGVWVGGIFLFAITVLAIYNDVMRL